MGEFEIVDFLYVDKDRIFNYYAQMFEGVLKNISQKESVKEKNKKKTEKERIW